MKIVKKITGWFGIVILVIAILLVGFMFIGPRFGWETHPVLSGSMEPALKVGGVIVTKPERLENIQVGDIITFQTEPELKVTHRVIDIVEIEGKIHFQTKGDANEEPDPNFVSSKEEEMRKVVFHLSYFGFVAQFVKSKWIFPVIGGIIIILAIWEWGPKIKEGLKEEKEKKKLKASNPEKGKKGQS